MTSLSETMFLQIGKRRYQVATFDQASVMFCAARDKSGYGASRMPQVTIVTETGREIARVSYNGRVWPAGDWTPAAKPIYDNRVA